MPRMTVRLLFSMLYIGILLFGAGFILRRLQSFEGVIIIEKGRTERWATCPAGEGRSFTTAHRNMPAEVIGFDNPRAAVRVLGARDQFDAAPLPFRLKLMDVTVLERPPEVSTLEIIRQGDTMSVPVKSGASLSLPEGVLVISGMESWRGLIRDGRGEPMAAFSLQTDSASSTPVFFVDTRSVVRPMPLLAVALQWFPNEAAARAQAGAAIPPDVHTRWGVSDVGRIHWFESLLPGTGVTTSDGAEYTLMEVIHSDDEHLPPVTAITVQKNHNGKEERIRVEANANATKINIILESFRDEASLRLHAWRDGAALVMTYDKGQPSKTILLNEGDSLDINIKEASVRFRLDQLMGAALPVSDGDVQALVLDTPRGQMRLREGQSVQLEESRLRFRRMPQPPVTRVTLQVISSGDDTPNQSFTLSPSKSRRIGQWRFTHDVYNADAETIAVLRAERIPGTPAQYLGAFLFLVGALGLSIFRFADWHAIGHEDAAAIMEVDTWTPVPTDDTSDNTTPDDTP